jgi:hypothetical protein
VECEASLPAPLIRWVDALRERELNDLAHLFVRVLQIWGYAGGQVLWMLAPFLGEAAVTPFAHTLEDPEALEALHARIAEGAPR